MRRSKFDDAINNIVTQISCEKEATNEAYDGKLFLENRLHYASLMAMVTCLQEFGVRADFSISVEGDLYRVDRVEIKNLKLGE